MAAAGTGQDSPVGSPMSPVGESGHEPVDVAGQSRDSLVDVLRSASLGMVVVWHWVFTVVVWHSDGPHASNPIGTTTGLWLITWLLQVMPVFFLVGGAVHGRALGADDGWRRFVARRSARLIPPSLALAGGCAVMGLGLDAFDVVWAKRAAFLIGSPLWFIGIYLILVLIAPPLYRMHRAAGILVPVLLAALAVCVDVLRFNQGWEYVEWLNWVFVWAAVHQLGFHWERLRELEWSSSAAIAVGGLGGLIGLTNMNLYPRSMVGVPGEALSNMGPPTLPIVALAVFQTGTVLLLAGWLEAQAERRPVRWLRANAMTVFAAHSVAYAAFYSLWVVVAGGHPTERTTWGWWAERPLFLLGPGAILATMLWIGNRIRHLRAHSD